MKNIILAITLCIITPVVFGQNATYNDFKNNFEGDEDITNINIAGSLFSLIGEIAMEIEMDPEIKEFMKIADGIDQVNIFTVPKGKNKLASAIDDLHSGLSKEKYDNLANFKKGKENTEVYMQGTKKSITSAMILIDGANEFTVMSIEGNLTYSDLSGLLKNMDHRH